MLATVKNKQFIDMNRNYVDLLYYERELSSTGGSFIVSEEKTSSGSSKSAEGNPEKKNTKFTSRHVNIWSFFVVQPETAGTKASQTNFIELSDTEEDRCGVMNFSVY